MGTTGSKIKALQSLNIAATAAAKSLAGMANAYEHFVVSLYAMVWANYLRTGAPYGATREGMAQWVRERAALDNHPL